MPPFNQSFLSTLQFSVLTPMLAQCSSILALTYTTQVRSSGSQVCVGNRNHRTERVPVLRRAPTLTVEQRQQRVGLRALSPFRALAEVREGETPGKAKDSTFQGPSSRPRESLQGLISYPQGQTMGKLAHAVFGSTLRQSGCLLG